MEILVKNQSRKKFIPANKLRKLTSLALGMILEKQPFNNPLVSVLFVDDARMQRLNKQYRHIDKPTDVLSFMMLGENDPPTSPDEPTHLGDIVISLETASRQAKEMGHSIEKEILILLLHGYLHLLGFTDDKATDRRKMEKEQNLWLENFENAGLI